jgi:hypothetical protein
MERLFGTWDMGAWNCTPTRAWAVASQARPQQVRERRSPSGKLRHDGGGVTGIVFKLHSGGKIDRECTRRRSGDVGASSTAEGVALGSGRRNACAEPRSKLGGHQGVT